MDSEKQRSVWLFLGEYTPEKDTKKELWDINPEEKESEEIITKNGLENYVNTLQEKLKLTEGRLKGHFLRDFFAFNPLSSPDIIKYIEEDLKFEIPVVLTINSSHPDDEPQRNENEGKLKLRVEHSKCIFKSLEDMAVYKDIEESMWADPYALINYTQY